MLVTNTYIIYEYIYIYIHTYIHIDIDFTYIYIYVYIYTWNIFSDNMSEIGIPSDAGKVFKLPWASHCE